MKPCSIFDTRLRLFFNTFLVTGLKHLSTNLPGIVRTSFCAKGEHNALSFACADECTVDGKAALFDQARGYLMVGEQAIPYAEAARSLGMDEGAVRVAVHRLRKRYREILRDQIADTLTDPAQVADELRSLQAALAS